MRYLLFFALPLLATVNEPLRVEWFTGYRNDHLHWHDQTLDQVYPDMQFWENGLTLQAIHRDLTFFLRGSYGAAFPGWCADVSGYFGYAVNLTDGRHYKTLFTPFVGYAGYFEQMEPWRLSWNGFFLGASLAYNPATCLALQAGYAYNFLANHYTTPDFSTDTGGNPGQTGWATLDFLLPRAWRLGFGSKIYYFSVHTDAPIKLRWTSVSAWLQLSKEI